MLVSRSAQPHVDTMRPALLICGNGTDPDVVIEVADMDCAHALVDAAVGVLVSMADKTRRDVLIDAQARDREVENMSDMPMSPGWSLHGGGGR
ncbi:MAG: hypothetical protein KC729_21020 [Candidatus Eisenbacteria bacterium]|uniref:Uncharacterized protein n=1 Tax=Eiseniibacteriota bacterium TaxID=2212470 RepID=A0A956RRN5_UNCEI|nr:hypothetical protein [Candidatus Eisenbacteria bacterium]